MDALPHFDSYDVKQVASGAGECPMDVDMQALVSPSGRAAFDFAPVPEMKEMWFPPVAPPQAPVAFGWRKVFGNVYQDAFGQKHVCDFTCRCRVWSDQVNYFVCGISGLPARTYVDSAKKRGSLSAVGLGEHTTKRRA